MTAAPVHVGTARLMLDPAGVAWWPDRKLLVVSDLHLEKGSAAAVRGRHVPPYDSRATLDRLGLLLRRYRPARVVALGDTFHDGDGLTRMGRAEHATLLRYAADSEFVWVTGNHDPVPVDLPGHAATEWHEDGIAFRHDGGTSLPELCGHCHPKASIETRGQWITRPCFVTDGRRMMLPAFGAYTGGLDVRDRAISRLFPRGMRVFLLGRERLYSFPIGGSRAAVA
jgi:DNA ligase-associated metallophosphoesterase